MLTNLSIQNVAVIEKADVDFSDGFNILTGETGAGKSILMDALGMVLGMRTSKDLVRSGAQNASVTAIFSDAPSLEEFDIEPEEDMSLVLSRKLSSDGKNVCKINSQIVPLSTLKAVGEKLVTIHGQHDNILLLKSGYHLSLLDEYAKNRTLLDTYQALYHKCNALKEKLEAMKISESEREEKKDILTFKINEIKKVEPQIGEDEALQKRRDALRNYQSIMNALNLASEALSYQGSAKDCLYSAMQAMTSASNMDGELLPISERLTDLYYNVEDVASEVNSIISKMSYSPMELDEIEERLDLITRLKKKYGFTIEECLKNLEEWENELNTLSFYEDNLTALEKELEENHTAMVKAGEKLHLSRITAGEKLSKAIEEELLFLDMPKVKFSVGFIEHTPTLSGLYSAEFMISTNPSEGLKSLSKIASGGEMSRIMLALKAVLADCEEVTTLIFDEIDTGVSGRAAAKIAQKLKMLAKSKQVLCITHLPQMASRADSHLLIRKDTSSETFTTSVSLLDFEGRVEELSRLISSDEVTESARKAAEEMLKEGME